MNFNINCSTCSLQFVKTAIFQRDTFTRPLRNFFTASIISFFSFSRLLDTSCWTWHTCSACNCNCSHHVTTHRSTCVSWYPVENYIQVNVCQLVPSWEPHTGQCVSAGTQLRTTHRSTCVSAGTQLRTTYRSRCVSWYPVENYTQVDVCQLVPSWEPHTGRCVSAGTQLRTTYRSRCVSWYPVENYTQVDVCQLVPSWELHTGQCVSAGTQLRTTHRSMCVSWYPVENYTQVDVCVSWYPVENWWISCWSKVSLSACPYWW